MPATHSGRCVGCESLEGALYVAHCGCIVFKMQQFFCRCLCIEECLYFTLFHLSRIYHKQTTPPSSPQPPSTPHFSPSSNTLPIFRNPPLKTHLSNSIIRFTKLFPQGLAFVSVMPKTNFFFDVTRGKRRYSSGRTLDIVPVQRSR